MVSYKFFSISQIDPDPATRHQAFVRTLNCGKINKSKTVSITPWGNPKLSQDQRLQARNVMAMVGTMGPIARAAKKSNAYSGAAENSPDQREH